MQQSVSVLFRYVREIWRAFGWWRSLSVGEVNFCGNIPLNGSYEKILWVNGFSCFDVLILLVNSGQCICFGVLGAGSISDSEMEVSEEERPPGLARIQMFSRPQIFQVFMFS